MDRLIRAGRVNKTDDGLGYRFFVIEDSPVVEFTSHWDDTAGNIPDMIYAVQTNTKLVERCMLMTTDPGDLVFDPTCGSGTTAFVAEQWGRRWITSDTSRIALALTRQRLLTARFSYYALRSINTDDILRNPSGSRLSDPVDRTGERRTLDLRHVPHVTLKAIAGNQALDHVFAKHDPAVVSALATLNKALARVDSPLRGALHEKLAEKQRHTGTKSITESDRRRWILPTEWREWEVPFDSDIDWPEDLKDAFELFQAARGTRQTEIDRAILDAAQSGSKELVDDPNEVDGVVRVTGPFTVEGVRPEELSLGDDGLFDPTPNQFETEGARWH